MEHAHADGFFFFLDKNGMSLVNLIIRILWLMVLPTQKVRVIKK